MWNILFVSHSSELNGAERMLLQLIAKIDRERFRPFLVIPEEGLLGEEARKLEVETFTVPMKWWLTGERLIWRQPVAWVWNMPGILRLAGIIRSRGIDLVFSNSSAAFSGALVARMSGVPHVWYIHEVLDGERPILRFLFGNRRLAALVHRLSARVIVNSMASRRAFEGRERVVLVYNGIETGGENRAAVSRLKKEFGLGEKDRILGIVGKIYEGKGQKEVIQTLPSLLMKHPGLKLLVIGEVRDRGYDLALRKILRDHDLEHRVFFTGFRNDILDLLQMMDLLIVASRVESFGRSAIEAMAVRTPVLALKVGGLPEIIEHGKTGFLVSSLEPGILAEAVDMILRNPEKAREVADSGWLAVKEKFSLERQVRKVERIIAGCLREKEENV